MGLWLKKDGEFVPVSGGGGDAGPHDHDYLPLAGGTVAGDLEVDGILRLKGASESHIGNSGSEGREVLEIRATDGGIAAGAGINLYGTGDATNPDRILFYTGNQVTQALEADRSARFYGDLQVDGNADITINVPSDYWRGRKAGTIFHEYGGIVSQGSFSTALNSNGYRNGAGTWTNLGHGPGATVVELFPTGGMHVRVASDYPTGSPAHLPSRFVVTESGPSFRAMPSKTRTVDDVLERAETAEFPPEDDDGVVTMDGYDEVPLFEVVTALLAKVKELSATVADQTEKIAALEGVG
jgi:hypothetical protein